MLIRNQHDRRSWFAGYLARAGVGGNVCRLGRICRGLRRGLVRRAGGGGDDGTSGAGFAAPVAADGRSGGKGNSNETRGNENLRHGWLLPEQGCFRTDRKSSTPGDGRTVRHYHEAVSAPGDRGL